MLHVTHGTKAVLLSVVGILANVTEPGQAFASDDVARPAAIAAESVPPVPQSFAQRLSQYQNVRSASFSGWAPDGNGILIETRFGNTTQLHRVYEPGGRREQITFFDEPTEGRFVPGDNQNALLLSMSTGGNEAYQVLRLDRHSRGGELLTDGKSRNLLGPVRQDGLFCIIASTKRNGRDTDLYVSRTEQPAEMELVLQTDAEYWSPQDWARDGSRLLINQYVSINETYPAVLDLSTGQMRKIPIPTGQRAAFGTLAFSPDGRHAYATTDARGGFRELARIDLQTFEFSWLTEQIPWDVRDIDVEPQTGLVAFTVNNNGASDLYLLDGDTYCQLEVPLGIVSSLEFSPDGKHLGFTLARPTRPADVYSMQLSDDSLTRWTYSEIGSLDPDAFVEPTRFRYKSFDDREIPAYYFKPREASAEKPAAVVINIHGGPESQYRPYFSSTDQFYLNELGIAVIRPNVRGSAGYGKSYLLLDNAEKREDSVKDIGALLDWIAEQPELDASRVAVMGGSYGGYMVLSSLMNFGERIRAGVDVVGIASFTTFLQNTSAYRRDLRRAEYGDERDPKMQAVFERINPLNHADKIRSALLVAHGRNDPRVPFSEAEQIAPKVRANGQTVWTIYADNEGHGFRKKDNRDYLTAVIALFLQEHLTAK